MVKTKVLGLCGSLRADSWNRKLLKNFVSYLDSDQFTPRIYESLEMPLMNQDLEGKPLHTSILSFRAALEESPIVIFASPEYNASLSPVMKNCVDWASRPPGNLWAGKIGVLLSASPGGLGGARGLIHLRTVLSGLKIWVIPEQVQCALADKAFDQEGKLVNEGVQKQIKGAVESLVAFSGKLLR